MQGMRVSAQPVRAGGLPVQTVDVPVLPHAEPVSTALPRRFGDSAASHPPRHFRHPVHVEVGAAQFWTGEQPNLRPCRGVHLRFLTRGMLLAASDLCPCPRSSSTAMHCVVLLGWQSVPANLHMLSPSRSAYLSSVKFSVQFSAVSQVQRALGGMCWRCCTTASCRPAPKALLYRTAAPVCC